MQRRHMLAALAAAAGTVAMPGLAVAHSHRHHGPDIVDVAASTPGFSTLVAAVTAAGLVDTLKGRGPFTVFAPTDDAFAQLPAETIDSLLQPENRDQLVNILTYHVVPGTLRAARLLGTRGRVVMVNGDMINFDGTDGVVINRSATVTATDIAASNGLIHVIDRVLLPH